MKPIAIAYLISRYPAVSHTFILREVQQLRALGFRIDVASINPPDRPLSSLTVEEHQEARQTFYVKKQGAKGAGWALLKTLCQRPLGVCKALSQGFRLGGWDAKRQAYQLFYLLEAVLIGQWMARHGYRHLHVHFATPAASVGMLVKTVFAVGFSMTVHGPDEFYDAPGLNLPEKIAAADFICCISHFARSQLMKLSPISDWDKFELCRLGVDHNRFQALANNGVTAADKISLLCVGRLTPAKGQHILLNAVQLLLARGYPVSLTLVGNGPDLASLQAHAERLQIAHAVEFAGAVDQDHLLPYYQQADIFVLASFAEGLPVVLMEAMAMAVPCISTRIAGIPELLDDGINGLLVAASDSDGLADAIARLCNDPALRQQLALAGSQCTRERYDLQRNSQHLAAVLGGRLAAAE